MAGTELVQGTPKSEIRNIEIRNKFEFKKFKNSKLEKIFGFGAFGFFSKFGFRVSNFESAASIRSLKAIFRTKCLLSD